MRDRPLTQVADQDLVRSARDGDVEAFEALILRHQRKAWALAHASGLPAGAIQDVVQEAFLQCLRNLPTLRSPASFCPWLLGILRNVIRNRVRARRAGEPLPDERKTTTTPLDSVSQRELRSLVWERIQELPQDIREVVFLYYYEGESVRETAAGLGVPIDTVKNRLRRGRQLLRRSLWRELGNELRDIVPSADEWIRRGRRLSVVVAAAAPGAMGPASGLEAAEASAGSPSRPVLARRGSPRHRALRSPATILAATATLAIVAVWGSSLLVGAPETPKSERQMAERRSRAVRPFRGGTEISRRVGDSPRHVVDPGGTSMAENDSISNLMSGPAARKAGAFPDGSRENPWEFRGGVVELFECEPGQSRFSTGWYRNRSDTEVCGLLARTSTRGGSYLGLVGIEVEVDPDQNPEADFDVDDVRNGIWNRGIDPEEDTSADEDFDDEAFDGAPGASDDSFHPKPHRTIRAYRSHGNCVGDGELFRLHLMTDRPVGPDEGGTIEVRQEGTYAGVLHQEGLGILTVLSGAMIAGKVRVLNLTGKTLRRIALDLDMHDGSFHMLKLLRLEREGEDQYWSFKVDGNAGELTPSDERGIEPDEEFAVYYRLFYISPPGGGGARIRGFER